MGAGRIGKMHAKFIAAHPKAKLKYIYDINSEFAEEVAKSTGCSIASSPEEAINADDVDAVLIASATLCDEKALKIIHHIYGLAGFVIEGNYRE